LSPPSRAARVLPSAPFAGAALALATFHPVFGSHVLYPAIITTSTFFAASLVFSLRCATVK
jgi:hypothetical protein